MSIDFIKASQLGLSQLRFLAVLKNSAYHAQNYAFKIKIML